MFKREILTKANTKLTAQTLQDNLATLIHLSLDLKQAHWNVVGPNFRSLHLQLDEIIETTRAASDEIAERVVALGKSPDGRPSIVAEATDYEPFPEDFHSVSEMVELVADRLYSAAELMRKGIEKIGDHDPISQDILIGFCGRLEKHLWMLQAQEVVEVEAEA